MRTIGLLAMLGWSMAQTPKYDVASIKVSDPDVPAIIRNLPGGRMEMQGLTLKGMTITAWEVQAFQVTGGPPWVGSARDRFQLVVRQETREMPVYDLVARKDGKSGIATCFRMPGSGTVSDFVRGARMRSMPVAPQRRRFEARQVWSALLGVYDAELKWSSDPSD
jgi:hypothetical protein